MITIKQTTIMTKTINGIQVPQRADFVGSFLRPADLNDSNRDEYVAQLVEKQKELGYTLITDGEFNRTFWHLDFFWGFGGVTHEPGGDIAFNGETARLDRVYLTGKLTAQPHHRIPDIVHLHSHNSCSSTAIPTAKSTQELPRHQSHLS
jgi:5-methyltetrahydropteroyltriglutamate--homocysteine methyltransferase